MPDSKFEPEREQRLPTPLDSLFEALPGSRQFLVSSSLALALKSAAEEAGEPLALPRREQPGSELPAGWFKPAFEGPLYGAPSEEDRKARSERGRIEEDFSLRVMSAIIVLSQRAAVADLGECVIAEGGAPVGEFAGALRELLPMTDQAAADVLPWVVADLAAAIEHAPLRGGWGELLNRAGALVLIPSQGERRTRTRRVRVTGGLARRD